MFFHSLALASLVGLLVTLQAYVCPFTLMVIHRREEPKGSPCWPTPYDELYRELGAFIPAARLITDPLRLLAWGTDASFYRLVPKLVVVVEESEIRRLLECCARLQTPVTFRAAGTSLSGQASATRCW